MAAPIGPKSGPDGARQCLLGHLVEEPAQVELDDPPRERADVQTQAVEQPVVDVVTEHALRGRSSDRRVDRHAGEVAVVSGERHPAAPPEVGSHRIGRQVDQPGRQLTLQPPEHEVDHHVRETRLAGVAADRDRWPRSWAVYAGHVLLDDSLDHPSVSMSSEVDRVLDRDGEVVPEPPTTVR